MWRRGICRGALLVTLAPGSFFAVTAVRGPSTEAATEPVAAPPRVHCAAPRTLRLRHFEDRSAQLLCDRRVIVRVAVPG